MGRWPRTEAPRACPQTTEAKAKQLAEQRGVASAAQKAGLKLKKEGMTLLEAMNEEQLLMGKDELLQ